MTKTIEQLKQEIAKVLSNEELVEVLLWDYWQVSEWHTGGETDTCPELSGFDYRTVDHYGGEGLGNDYFTVYEFRYSDLPDSPTVFVKFQGWNASYEGPTYESWSFTEPKQKMITVYE
jgi:hypothetical protein